MKKLLCCHEKKAKAFASIFYCHSFYFNQIEKGQQEKTQIQNQQETLELEISCLQDEIAEEKLKLAPLDEKIKRITRQRTDCSKRKDVEFDRLNKNVSIFMRNFYFVFISSFIILENKISRSEEGTCKNTRRN